MSTVLAAVDVGGAVDVQDVFDAAPLMDARTQIGTESAQTRAPLTCTVDARGRRVASPPKGGGFLFLASASGWGQTA